LTRQGTRRQGFACGEQGKLLPPKNSSLPKGTKAMAEQKAASFMQELDRWTEATVINPLEGAIMDANQKLYQETVERIQKAVRQKVLESHRNGQKAGDYKPAGRRETRYAQAQTR
jgi:hypothetical protein